MEEREKNILIGSSLSITIGVLLLFGGINSINKGKGGELKAIGGMLTASCGVALLFDIFRDPIDSPPNQFDYNEAIHTPEVQQLIEQVKKELLDNEFIKEQVLFVHVRVGSWADDTIHALAVATNKRIIKFIPGLIGKEFQSIPLTKISSVSSNEGMMFDSLCFTCSNNDIRIEQIIKGNTKKFVRFVNSKVYD